LICADEVRYADSISSGTRLYISSRNAYVTSPRSIFNLVEGYGQYFIKVTNSANSQKVAIGRQWINRIDSTSGNKALIYIKDINVTFTTTESYSVVVDSAISCFQRAVSSGLATLSDGDYGDVVVSGSGLVMTVDKPDLGLHNLADGDFSVVADSTALSLTNTRRVSLTTKTIDGWLSRLLQENNQITLRTSSATKVSRIFVDTTGANFQFVNGANNASLRIGDSVAVRFNSSGSVGQVLTVTSVDGDGRMVINPKTGGSGTANCEQTLTKTSHGFRKWTPIYWTGSTYVRPPYDSLVPDYIVVDSLTANTFKVANCGTYTTSLTNGLYWFTSASPGYSLTADTTKVPLFQVLNGKLILNPIVGFNLMAQNADGNGIISALPLDTVSINNAYPLRIVNGTHSYNFDGFSTMWTNSAGGKYFGLQGNNASGWNAGFGVSGSGGYSFDREVHTASAGYSARFFDITYLPWNGYAVPHDAMNITTEGEVVHAYGDPFGVWGGRTEFYATTSYESSKRSFLFKNVTSYHANKKLVDFQNSTGTIAALKQDGKFYVGNDSVITINPVGTAVVSLENTAKNRKISLLGGFEVGVFSNLGSSRFKVSDYLGNNYIQLEQNQGWAGGELQTSNYRYALVTENRGTFSNILYVAQDTTTAGRNNDIIHGQIGSLFGANGFYTRHVFYSNQRNNRHSYLYKGTTTGTNFFSLMHSTDSLFHIYSNGQVKLRYYSFANVAPNNASGAISNQIWTAGVPSFLRSQHGVTTGSTDGSGDLTITFAAAMPDATYTVISQNEGTTAYILSAHTKATGSVKVRVFDAAGAAVTATSVTISYEAKDY